MMVIIEWKKGKEGEWLLVSFFCYPTPTHAHKKRNGGKKKILGVCVCVSRAVLSLLFPFLYLFSFFAWKDQSESAFIPRTVP